MRTISYGPVFGLPRVSHCWPGCCLCRDNCGGIGSGAQGQTSQGGCGFLGCVPAIVCRSLPWLPFAIVIPCEDAAYQGVPSNVPYSNRCCCKARKNGDRRNRARAGAGPAFPPALGLEGALPLSRLLRQGGEFDLPEARGMQSTSNSPRCPCKDRRDKDGPAHICLCHEGLGQPAFSQNLRIFTIGRKSRLQRPAPERAEGMPATAREASGF